jgi:GT2 family glycosyltransferase
LGLRTATIGVPANDIVVFSCGIRPISLSGFLVMAAPSLSSFKPVSVVIAAFTEQRWSDLVDAVASAKKQSLPAKEIIIAVDHNPSLLGRITTEISDVIAIPNRFARGAPGARNSGVAASTGAILAFLDDDAVADPDWLLRLSDGYADESVCAVGGRIDPLWLDGRPRWFPEEFNWVVGASYKGGPVRMEAVRNLWTVNMSVLRSVFDGVGGFRPYFGKVGARSRPEDTELCIRIGQAWPSKAILYNPDAKVLHKVHAGRVRFSYFASRCYHEGFGKAELARYFPQSPVLGLEHRYLRRVLSESVVAGCHEAFFRGHFDDLARVGAIISGVSCAFAGFSLGAFTGALSYSANRISAPSVERQ